MNSRPKSHRAYAFALLVAAIGFVNAAQAAILTSRVDGLPRGLTVSMNGSAVQCTSTGTSSSTTMVEDSQTIVRLVTMPFGGQSYVTETIYFYVGSISVSCNSGSPNALFKYSYSVAGERDTGALTARTTEPFLLPINGNIHVTDKLEAASLKLTRSGVEPTTLAIGTPATIYTQYSDVFGGRAIANPTLEITRPFTANGLNLSLVIARAVIDDNNQVCLTSGSARQCGRVGANGTLTAGLVAIHTGKMTNTASNRIRDVNWVIELTTGFTAGTIGLAARADDFDSVSYFVNGDSVPLDLLPWKVKRIAVEAF